MTIGKTPQAVMGGLASALCLLAFAFGGPLAVMLSWTAGVPLYLVALSMGPALALRGVIAGALMISILWTPALLVFMLAIGLPALALSWAALTPLDLDGDGRQEFPGSGHLLILMVGYAIAIITIAGFAFSAYEGGLTGLLLATMQEPIQAMLAAMDFGFSDEEISMLAQSAAVSLPSALGLYWVVWTVVNMAIANAILRRSGTALRPDFGVLKIAPPPWASIFFLALVGVSFAAGSMIPESVTAMVARNAVILMVLVFFMVGLAVIHVVTMGRPARALILILVYALILMSGWIAMVIAGLGIIEQWARLRDRYARNRTDEED